MQSTEEPKHAIEPMVTIDPKLVEPEPTVSVTKFQYEQQAQAQEPQPMKPQEKTSVFPSLKHKRVLEVVFIGVLAWLSGAAWNHMVLGMVDELKNTTLRYFLILVWAVLITTVFVWVVWNTTDE